MAVILYCLPVITRERHFCRGLSVSSGLCIGMARDSEVPRNPIWKSHSVSNVGRGGTYFKEHREQSTQGAQP